MISGHIKLFCREDISKIENYDKAISDNTQIWHCHHRRETIYTRQELIEIGEYYHRPACELIFLTREEHSRLHANGNKYALGYRHTEEARRRMSVSAKVRIRKPMSESTKLKLSKRCTGKKRSQETIEKIRSIVRGRKLGENAKKNMREAKKGCSFWYNNGEIQIRACECPEGFVKGRLNNLGTRWYNNGIVELYDKVCPEGFVPGRLKKKIKNFRKVPKFLMRKW